MAIFRSLKTLITGTQSPNLSSSRSFFTLCLSSTSPTIPLPPPLSIFSTTNPFISRRTNFFSRSRCPLFLSSPPWKLSQSATPLHLQSDVVLFHLARVRALSLTLPRNLGLEKSASSALRLINDTDVAGVRESDLALKLKVTDSFLNIPNLISISRLLSGPLLAWMIVHDMYGSAFVGLAISGATDWLDGYMARKMGINSVVGSYLDPLADKVLIGFVALAMVDKGLLHPGLVALVVLRDVALVGGAVYKRASSLNWAWKSWLDFFNLDGTQPQKVEPLLISKVNTVFQLVLVAAALLQPEFGNEDTRLYITYLSWLVALTTVSSTVAYGTHHLKSK